MEYDLQGYSELRGIRSGMEETATTARREVGGGAGARAGEGVHRRGQGEGALPAGRGGDQLDPSSSSSSKVGPAVSITVDYRARVGELERLATGLVRSKGCHPPLLPPSCWR